jgi:menaquinol-cytochrome c reductase iron-sulfur subunit
MSESPTHTPDRPASPSRRGFLFTIGLLLNAVAGVLLGIPIVGYLLSPTKRMKQQDWINLGALADYPEHKTRLATYVNPIAVPWDGETAKLACWVRRLAGEKFQVFAINCAHLGCPVRWFEESELFLCPCHGGTYYADGQRASGPPPRGLFEYEYKAEKGILWVRGGQMPTLTEKV